MKLFLYSLVVLVEVEIVQSLELCIVAKVEENPRSHCSFMQMATCKRPVFMSVRRIFDNIMR